jgi:hypothetical protein
VIGFEYEMSYFETIDGPIGSTHGSPPERLCWQVKDATLHGPRITARLAAPGLDWVRVDPDGTRRPDLRAQLRTDDGALVLLHYEVAVIRASERFEEALANGEPTDFDEQYMRMAPVFEVGASRYWWLTQSLFLGRGRMHGPRAIEYEIYRIA